MNDLKNASGFMCHLHPSATLAITAMAKEMKEQGHDVCSMCAGEPDFDTPQPIKDACIAALEAGKVTYTPASGAPELRKLLAAKFQKENGIRCAWDEIVVAPGAKYSCFTAIAALCGPGDEVIIPAPYWLSYPEMVTAVGAKVVEIPTRMENNYELDPADLEAAITENTRLLILNTPSNPTGAVYRRETLEKIAEIAVRRNIMILADEIYEKLTYDADKPHVSIASLSDEVNEHVVTVNGFSKTYAMTGWRLGYACGPAPIIRIMTKIHQSAIMSAPTTSQYAAITALKECDGEIDRMRDEYNMRRRLVVKSFNDMGLTCFEPRGAFYAFPCIKSTGMSSQDFCTKLLEQKHVAIIPGDAFGASGEGYARISYAYSVEHLKEALRRIREFLQENGIYHGI